MGAISFIEKVETTLSVDKEYRRLSAYYEQEYGDRSYNGTLSTCSLGVCRMKFEKYSESNLKKAYKYIEDNHYGEKWQADYIDLGVVGYNVVTVKKKTLKNKPEYKLRYVVCKNKWLELSPTDYNFATKTEADKKAMELTLNSGVEYAVTKEYILVKNSKNEVTRCEISTKAYKSKPNLKAIPGRKIVPVKKYIFFGWASC